MGFLTPIYLLLGAGITVPVLVHLLRRRAGARVDFPAVRYLARAEQEHSRQLRLRNVLLMLLRIAAIALVALAAARPVLGRAGGGGLAHLFGGGHAPIALAIVLDNSLSTSAIVKGQPVLEQLKAAARHVADRAAGSDRVWLLTADGAVRPGRSIAGVTPMAGAGDLPGAIEHAAALIRSAGLPTGIIAVATDAQATAWSRPIDVGEVSVALFAPSDAPPANHGVIDVQVRPARWTPAGTVTATIFVSTGGMNAAPTVTGAASMAGLRDSVGYRITLGGRTVARGTVASPGDRRPGAEPLVPSEQGPSPPSPARERGARGEREDQVSARVATTDRGWVAGTVELDPDELRGDDVRHFAVWIGDPPSVAVDSSGGPFVRGAVASLLAGGRIAHGGVTGRAPVSIVAADHLTTLPALIIAPSDPVRLGAANRALEREGVPWRFGSVHTAAGPQGAALALSHSRDGEQSDPPLDDVAAARWYTLEPVAGSTADTLVTVAGGEPWAVTGQGYVVIATPLDPGVTSLPIRAVFLPWLESVLTKDLVGSAAAGGGIIDAAPGESVHRPEWAASIEAPDGPPQALSGATITAPSAPGVTFLRNANAARAGALVVNPEPRESDLRRLPLAAIASQLHAKRVVAEDDATRWSQAVFDLAAGRPLVLPLLLGALALLAIEALVLHRKRNAA